MSWIVRKNHIKTISEKLQNNQYKLKSHKKIIKTLWTSYEKAEVREAGNQWKFKGKKNQEESRGKKSMCPGVYLEDEMK